MTGRRNIIFTCFACLILLMGCSKHSQESDSEKKAPKWELPYDLNKPTAAVSLPDELHELSGLATISDAKIACIQDENGQVFIFDHFRSELDTAYTFGKDHDYEGISWVDEHVYVLQSNGKLYEIKNLGKDSQETIKHKTFLKKANNTEGLAYDKVNNQLLISCRGIPGDKESLNYLITMYSFDLETQVMDSVPAVSFTIDDIYDYLGIDGVQKGAEKGANFLVPGLVDKVIFHPSGIAVHPFSGDIYVVAAQSKGIMVLSPDGNIKFLKKLKKITFEKPEGITFLPNGDMLIANEGGKKLEDFSTIFRFKYIPPSAKAVQP